jgi:hypothetical protein
MPLLLSAQYSAMKNNISGTWLLEQRFINNNIVTTPETERITFYEEGIIISYLDSQGNASRYTHCVYRFYADSAFIRLSGTDTILTYASSKFVPHHLYHINTISDSALTLSTSEGGTPILLTYKRTQTEDIASARKNAIHQNILTPPTYSRIALQLINTADSAKTRYINSMGTCEIHLGDEEMILVSRIIYTGEIWKHNDSTAAIRFSSKDVLNWSESDQTWLLAYRYEQGSDTIEYVKLQDISFIVTDTPKRNNRRTAGGGFLLSGGLTTMVLIAPLTGINWQNRSEWNERKYYNTLFIGTIITASGTGVMISNKKHRYSIRPQGTGETRKSWWLLK